MNGFGNSHGNITSTSSVSAAMGDRPMRPGGVSDSKTNLAHRIESLEDSVRGLAQALQQAGFLRALPPSVSGQTSQPKPPSVDSELSQHLSELAARVSAVTTRVEELTQGIDI